MNSFGWLVLVGVFGALTLDYFVLAPWLRTCLASEHGFKRSIAETYFREKGRATKWLADMGAAVLLLLGLLAALVVVALIFSSFA